MPKFQVIIELPADKFNSDHWFDDDMYKKMVELFLISPFNVLYVNNLDGMKKELYEKRDQMIDGMLHAKEPSEVVETTFDELKDLFKLD